MSLVSFSVNPETNQKTSLISLVYQCNCEHKGTHSLQNRNVLKEKANLFPFCMKKLRDISFGLLISILITLIIATIVEKRAGTEYAQKHIYTSVPFIVLWNLTALTAFLYMFRKKLQKKAFSFLLHISFFVILAGALTTHIAGKQGSLHLRKGINVKYFVDQNARSQKLPFYVSLKGFRIIYYPGTFTPQDFESEIKITDKLSGTELECKVAMNRIARYRGYRFYQSGYDNDGNGTRLSISYDPYGIAITYTGYVLLLIAMILFFFERRSTFRQLINHPLLKRTTLSGLLLLMASSGLHAADAPKVLPEKTAAQFGDLHVLYNGRICPLQTLAMDFTTKLYGKPSYKGYTPEQVFTGWMFYLSSWKQQPIFKIKGLTARQLLDIDGRYASFEDFFDRKNNYKLNEVKQKIQAGEAVNGKKEIMQANEKFNIIAMFYSGQMLKIFPSASDTLSTTKWYSPNDPLPSDIPNDKWIFIRKSMDYIHEMVIKKDYGGIADMIQKLREYQKKEAGGVLPIKKKFQAEKLCNEMYRTKPLAFLLLTIGLFSFILVVRKLMKQQVADKAYHIVLNTLLITALVYLAVFIALRGYASNHLPLSNGYETMQFMAVCSLILTLVLQKKFQLTLPFGFFISGLALMVSIMGQSNPPITHLMPVLSSPLLSIHVVLIMIAYSLLAFIMLNGISAVVLNQSKKDCSLLIKRLQILSQIILYPAVFLLTAGIFTGAVWANISWGRYWGWDPKEVWALIMTLIYSLALHGSSIKWFRRPMNFHIFSIVAFLSVVITYFGVNFILGGMHSYAG
jgi:ABC-type transport system involved in cytochrome c biogenesis permease subunit